MPPMVHTIFCCCTMVHSFSGQMPLGGHMQILVSVSCHWSQTQSCWSQAILSIVDSVLISFSENLRLTCFPLSVKGCQGFFRHCLWPACHLTPKNNQDKFQRKSLRKSDTYSPPSQLYLLSCHLSHCHHHLLFTK